MQKVDEHVAQIFPMSYYVVTPQSTVSYKGFECL